MDRGFRRVWSSGGISAFGTALSEVALPVIALFYAHASAVGLGVLISAEQWAWLVVGLPAGVWIDRWSRVRTAVIADCARAVLVGAVAITAWTGAARMSVLTIVAVVVGVCNVFGGVATGVLVPAVVATDELVAANARLNTTQTVASLSGSTVVGPVVAFLGAPVALAVDAVTFIASAVLLRGIRTPRTVPTRAPHFRRELFEGLRIVLREPLFRTLTLGSSVFNACTAAQYVLVFLLLRDLEIPKGWYGLLLAASGVGAVASGVVLPRLTHRFGDASVWRIAVVAGPLVGLLVPLARSGWGLVPFVIGSFGLTAAVATSSVIGWSVRQATCAPDLLGRASATTRVLTWGVIPIGALIGGWLGHRVDVHTALWIVAACYFGEPVLVRCSRVWRWESLPAAGAAATD